jgi:hypothetical protein
VNRGGFRQGVVPHNIMEAKMPNDLFTGYSERSDDELLHLASSRHSLTAEASTALDAELRRRNLTESDRIEHQRFDERQEQHESRSHRRKTFGPFKYQLSWLDVLWAFAAIALISFTYIALPSRYHMKSDWQEAAFIVMMTSVLIAIGSRSVFWRNFTFWMSLVMSSAIHLFVVHAFTQRVSISNLSRGAGRGAAVLGFLLFFGVYKFVSVLQRNFYGKGASDSTETADGRASDPSSVS